MVVGAAGDAVNGNYDQGAAYVFLRTGLTWTEQAKLVASDGGLNHEFGSSVGISGNTIVVGANGHSYKGAAYVFERVGTTWTEQAKLVAADGATIDYFGYSVAIAGDTVVIGAFSDDVGEALDQGSVYVFQRTGTTWTQQAKLVASDGTQFARFGDSVDIFGDTVVVGAVVDNVGSNAEQGSAYVFQRTGTTWMEQAKLVASDGSAGDNFGDSISLSNDTVVVGASRDDVGGAYDRGSAYVFQRAGTTWTEEAKLVASDGAPLDYFGYTVASSDDTAIVGAYHASAASSLQGTAYVFQRVGTTWTQLPKLVALDGETLDYFGFSVALAGDTLAIGAVDADDGVAFSRGALYVFRYAKSKGDPCSSASECTSGSCVDGVCCDTECGAGSPLDCQSCGMAMGGAVDGTCGPSVSGTICRASSGTCDVADACDGISPHCPQDVFQPDGAECRASAGLCDTSEECSGDSPICPPDSLQAAGVACRPSANVCDVAETCDGASAVCPVDVIAPDGTHCEGGSCMSGACDPTGAGGADAGGTAGYAGGADTDPGEFNPVEDGACSCRTPRAPAGAPGLVAFSVLLLAASTRRLFRFR